MTIVFVLTNHKGGVGKTTASCNLAFGLARALHALKVPVNKVLLIDTDSQAHATLLTTGRNDYGRENSLYSVVLSDRKDAAATMSRAIVESAWDENLHVLPGSALLESAERELVGIPGAPYRIQNPLNVIGSSYAAVIIDTRPSFSLMTEMGLLAATHALIPVEPRYLETVGLLSVVGKINEIREGWRHPELRVSGILVNKMDVRIRGHVQMLDGLKKHPTLGQLICGIIPSNEAITYSHHQHQSVFDYDANCLASHAYAKLIGLLAPQVMSDLRGA